MQSQDAGATVGGVRALVQVNPECAESQEVNVPLSEHEQQLLEQMEQALYAEDPKFASQMQGAGARAAARRRRVIGVVGVLLGLGLVLVGVNTTMWVGVAGFAVMVASVAFALTPPRGRAKLGTVQADGSVRPVASSPRARSPKASGSFMHRLEERWDRRRDQY